MVNALFTIDRITSHRAADLHATDGDVDLRQNTIVGFDMVVAFFLRIIRALAALPHSCFDGCSSACVQARSKAMLDIQVKTYIFKSNKHMCSYPPQALHWNVIAVLFVPAI
jgi:hypothetical protein